LSHPALAPVLDAGLTDEGHPYLVTAFVMAAPLADFAHPAPPLSDLLDQARAALQALHHAGLAHGRVRAATILARRTTAGATTLVTGFAPLPPFPTPGLAIADDLSQLQRLTSTLRV
jgi:serine/threonine-protein kinase